MDSILVDTSLYWIRLSEPELSTINPEQLPQLKKGEQGKWLFSVSFPEALPQSSVLSESHTDSSEQHGVTEANSVIKESSITRNLIAAKILLM